jgi:putative transposase
VMDEKIKFIVAVKSETYSFAEVCRQFGISRKCGYELVRRYDAEGEKALVERSRAAHSHPNALDEHDCAQLLAIKQRYPLFGPRKVRDYARLSGWQQLPAASTIGELFKRHGLVHPRKHRRRTAGQIGPVPGANEPNQTWCVDFKGQFRMGNARYCYPLTLSDYASRYLLVCRGLHAPSERAVWPYFEWAFREYGLPQVLHSDNGPPFASLALAGLSRLALWWLKLGITLSRIAPGHPEQNGRHERIHRTLKAHSVPAAAHLRAQQRDFDAFRVHYNEQRPHEALGGLPPARCYAPSPRPYPARVQEPHYADSLHVRRVRSNGQIKWRGQLVFVSGVLRGEPVGLSELDSDRWQIQFCSLALGLLNQRTGKIEPL